MIRLLAYEPTKQDLGTATDRGEAEDLARCFVDDPRDAIPAVFLYDNEASQFVGWVERHAPRPAGELR